MNRANKEGVDDEGYVKEWNEEKTDGTAVEIAAHHGDYRDVYLMRELKNEQCCSTREFFN